jgi:squalene-hopene/tetraprenyl-beta-curcumene cyclase
MAWAMAAALAMAGGVGAAEATKPSFDADKYEKTAGRGIEYLLTKGQAADGSYSAPSGIGVTALATTALLRHGRSPDDPAIARSLKYIEGFVQPDGGVYGKESFVKNYETSLAIVLFAEANRGGRYDELIRKADGFIKGVQWDEDEGHDKSSFYHGGAGYGKKARPDLSNTSFLIEALRAAGNGPDDPHVQMAMIFVSRCQNLESEHNTTPFAAKNPDGGFYYTPAAGGESFAEKTPEGGLRSYASMTYAGLKSMIYAGLKPDDQRVKAAMRWIQQHYDLKVNPGLGRQGLFYYYHTFAKTLAALGDDEIVDDKGVKHNWRSDLLDALAAAQQEDGSWVNDHNRWMEDDKNLVTSYALLALSYCKPAK